MYIAATCIGERGKLLPEHLRQIGEERFRVAVDGAVGKIIETEEMHGRGRRQRDLSCHLGRAVQEDELINRQRLLPPDFRLRVRSGKFDFVAGIIAKFERGRPDF